MRKLVRLLLAATAACLASPAPAQTVINFDSIPGGPNSGQVAPQYLIHDQYLGQGVRFDSGGGGVALVVSSNPVSPPNVCVATFLSGGVPYVSYSDPVTASFWSGGSPAVVNSVSIALSSSTSPTTLNALDAAGSLLGSASGGASQILTVTFPGQIGSVVILQGPMAFDDFTFDGLIGSSTYYCFGDSSSSTACPCGNTGQSGRGCDNSAATGGAQIAVSGTTSPDTIVLTSSSELPSASSIFLQGQASISPVAFGDGLRCAAGILKRLYLKIASAGVASAPGTGDPSITTQSASLGDTIAPGSTRYYQTYYRDPNPTFCPAPPGNTWNVTNGATIAW